MRRSSVAGRGSVASRGRAARRSRVARSSLLAGAAALAVAAAAVAVAPAAGAQQPVVLSEGHVDVLEVHLIDGQLALLVNDDTEFPAVTRDPASVVFQALPASELAVPPHPAYEFLGEPGDPIWYLPQTQIDGILWPGWNTQRLPSGVFENDRITLTLAEVDGPGKVFLFMEDAAGLPLHQFSVEDGFPDQQHIAVNVHAHASWAFTAEGTYTLWFQADATTLDGTALTTGPVAYTFVVGDLPDDPDEPDGPSQLVVATIPELGGALVISVDPDDREVTLPPAQLATTGDRLESTGELRPVRVTDTRPGAPGWTASGTLGPFTGPASGTVGPELLGWTPLVADQADGQGVVPGSPVSSGFGGGDGLSVSATLASAPAGAGVGTAVLGAGLQLELPTHTPAGAYQATLTLTVI